MAALVALLALSQLPPGPLDAFRANYASIKAELDFKFTGGSFKDNKRLWEGQVPDYIERHAENTDLTIVGHWACDGSAEYFRFGSPEEVLDRASKDKLKKEAGKVFYNVLFVPKTEALWDGEILCGHIDHPHYRNLKENPDWKIVRVNVVDDLEARYLSTGRGPLHWGRIFPHVLKYSGDIAPSRRQAMRWGNPTEVEIYRKQDAGGMGWEQIEVSYDPAVGYLPRFVRSLSYYPPNDMASSNEMYLIEARPCAAGGFVPIEWYNISFDVPNFKSRLRNYDESTDLAPPSTEVGVSHFRASGFRDFSGPVVLTEIKDVHSVASMGGTLARPARVSSLSLDGVKKLLGKRITTPAQKLTLNIDEAELRELGRRPSGTWWPYIAALTAALVSIALFLTWRRARASLAALALVTLGGASGCGSVGDPVIRLTAAYKETFVYIDPRTHELPMTLVVRNDGNQALRLLKADGGCSCRKVDQSSFPVVVRPGGSVLVPVKMSITPTTMPQGSQFQLETDKGGITVSAPLFTLVSHELNPETIANTYMNESDGWTFDLTHRVIFPAVGAKPKFDLKFPGEFTVARGETRSGRVGGAPAYAYEESNYRVTLNDHALGARKTLISLAEPGGGVVLEAPIVWKRVPFLSSIPDRVILGTRPVRVFLRCPDERVELTRVLSAPEGIKAVVSSTKEVTVVPGEHSPDVLSGTIEVATTAEGRPPLRIPIVRYQAPAMKSITLRTVP